eukprot:11407694-Heterocapsa_arctica.AAC.1
MAIFAKMENIKIDVYSHGIPCQTYGFDGGDEQNKNTISVYGATSTDGEHKRITTIYFYRKYTPSKRLDNFSTTK